MEIKFGRIGRISAILCFCFTAVLSLWRIFTTPDLSLPLGLYEFFVVCPFLGFIELPYCCACTPRCVAFTKIISRVTGYWLVRAITYIGLSAAGYAIYALKPPYPDGSLISMLLWLDVVAILYIVAIFRKEPNPVSEGSAASANAAPLPVKSASKAVAKPAATKNTDTAPPAGDTSIPVTSGADPASAPPSKAGNPFALMDNPFK